MKGFVYLFFFLVWVALPPTAHSTDNTEASSEEQKSSSKNNLPKLPDQWQYTAHSSVGAPREPATPIEYVTEPPNFVINGSEKNTTDVTPTKPQTKPTKSTHTNHNTTLTHSTSTEPRPTPTEVTTTKPHTKPTHSTPTEPRPTPTEVTTTKPHTKPTHSTPTEPQPTQTEVTPTKPHTKPTHSTPTEPQPTPTEVTPTKPHTKPTHSTPTEPQPTPTEVTPTKPHTKPTHSTPTEPRPTPTEVTPTKPHTKPTHSTPTKPHTEPTPTIPTSPSTPSSCGFLPDCPARGTQLIANPCPKSCQKYFLCQDGSWSAKVCMPWENFHPERLSCEWWWNVDCSWLQTTTPFSDLTTLPGWTTPSPITPRTPCVFTPKCPPKGTIKIADPCHCQKFFDCLDGMHQEMTCLPWDNFDPHKLECVFALDVDCSWHFTPPTPAPTTVTTAASTPTSTESSTTAAPTTIPTTQPTPALTTQTVPSTTSPTSTTPSANPNECHFKPSCPEVGLELIPIPCEDYCSKYYECKDGTAELKTCPKKWLIRKQNFHPVKKECQLASYVNCNWYKP